MAVFQTDNLWIGQLAEAVAVLHLDIAGKSVNVLSRQVLQELDSALDFLAGENAYKVLLIQSSKKGNFLAGADIHQFQEITTPEEAMTFSEQGQNVFAKLAHLPIPSVAIISGTCLGGGLELALACDYRVAVDHPKTQLGLPEVTLGLLPAWGGTVRLPRIVGLEKAFQMILSGRQLRAKEALKWGLVDEITQLDNPEPPRLMEEPTKQQREKLPLRRLRAKLLEGTSLGRWLIYRGTERLLQRQVPDDMPAQWEAFKAVKTGVDKGKEAGFAFEREAVGRLATSPASRNLVNVFLQREAARKLPERTPQEEPPIRRVGIVGAGVMGAGLIQLAVLKDCEVNVQEVNDPALGLGMLRVVGLLSQAVQRGLLLGDQLEQKLAAIHGTTTWRGFGDLDLVIEAAVENLEVKEKLFREMEEHVSPSTILVSNTSSLQIQKLQEGLKHIGRVAGLHFFNPVHKVPLVEIVHTPATQPEVLNSLRRFVVALGKTPVLVKDSPGFLVNRILIPYLNEAVQLVSEGVRMELVERTMKRFGMPVGPLELLDQVGLDVASDVAHGMKPVFGDRVPPHPVFDFMKSKRWLGEKAKLGFYRWSGKKKSLHLSVQTFIQEQAQSAGIRQMPASSPQEMMTEARERMVTLMVNEAAACLEARLVPDAEALDLAMILVTGWAPHRGGPLRYAKQRSYKEVVTVLKDLASRYGKRFQPCPELLRLASL